MKTLALLPLTYFAGVEGFTLFAPYAVAVLALGLLIKRRRAMREVGGW